MSVAQLTETSLLTMEEIESIKTRIIQESFEIADSTQGLILRSPDNSRFLIQIDNDGSLNTSKID